MVMNHLHYLQEIIFVKTLEIFSELVHVDLDHNLSIVLNTAL